VTAFSANMCMKKREGENCRGKRKKGKVGDSAMTRTAVLGKGKEKGGGFPGKGKKKGGGERLLLTIRLGSHGSWCKGKRGNGKQKRRRKREKSSSLIRHSAESGEKKGGRPTARQKKESNSLPLAAVEGERKEKEKMKSYREGRGGKHFLPTSFSAV